MTYQIHITSEAEGDLQAIYEYIAFELLSFQNAATQLSRLRKEIYSLREMPERYHRYEQEPWCSRGVRRFTVGNYCVFYFPNRETRTVEVLRVLYAGRDVDRIMAEHNF